MSDGNNYLYLSWQSVIERRAMISVPGHADLATVLIECVDRVNRSVPLPASCNAPNPVEIKAQQEASELTNRDLRLHHPQPMPLLWLQTDPTRGWMTAAQINTPNGQLDRPMATAYLKVTDYISPDPCVVSDSRACGEPHGFHRCDEIDGHRYSLHACSCGTTWGEP